MTLEADKETVRRWITGIWDEGSPEVFAELASADYVYRAPGQEDQRGEAVLEFGNAFRSAIPDLNNTIEEQIAEGHTVVTLGTTRGTHKGAFGDVAPTGNSIEMPWVMITRIRDGHIIEDLEIYDSLGLSTQLGAVSPQ